jgi:hypothetical protein
MLGAAQDLKADRFEEGRPLFEVLDRDVDMVDACQHECSFGFELLERTSACTRHAFGGRARVFKLAPERLQLPHMRAHDRRIEFAAIEEN